MSTYRDLAEKLVSSGYAGDMKSVPYGLTKSNTYEVFRDGAGWQSVDPFGNAPHSKSQHQALKLRGILTILLTYLSEDQLLHFRKIQKPISEMSNEQLLSGTQLVERTLISKGLSPADIVDGLLDNINIDK